MNQPMKAIAIALLFCPPIELLAQDTPQSVIVERIKENRSTFPQWDNGPDLREKAKSQGDVARDMAVNEDLLQCLSCPSSGPGDNPRIKDAAQKSELVAIGTVTSKISSLSAKYSFIVTDAQFKVSEILKGAVDPRASDDGGNSQELTVAMPGGKVKVDGHVVEASLSNEEGLKIGHTYLLFLKYLPASHSYLEVHGLNGFDITGDQVHGLYRGIQEPSAELLTDKSAYLAAVRASIERSKQEGDSK